MTNLTQANVSTPDEAGLRAARAVAGWELGHRDWADRLIGAYLHPEAALSRLAAEKAEYDKPVTSTGNQEAKS